jgi:hypothetical protein
VFGQPAPLDRVLTTGLVQEGPVNAQEVEMIRRFAALFALVSLLALTVVPELQPYNEDELEGLFDRLTGGDGDDDEEDDESEPEEQP